jgi:D-aminoacyl-tRNA deacylase
MCTALKTLSHLKKELQLDYEVSYECTHHGPSLSVPTMFVELGSSPGQWSDLRASEAVAKAAMEAIGSFEVSSKRAALGIGGPHYNRQFTEMALKGKARFGHMIPKYAIHSLTVEVLRQSVEKTVEKTDIAILDWKGIKGADKANVLKALGEIGLPYEKI